MIQTTVLKTGIDINTASGNGFSSGSIKFTLPQAFLNDNYNGFANVKNQATTWQSGRPDASNPTTVYDARFHRWESATGAEATVTLIGRWK